jgi:hypothetical protein
VSVTPLSVCLHLSIARVSSRVMPVTDARMENTASLRVSGCGVFALGGCSVGLARRLVGVPRRLMYQIDPLLYRENERA